MHTQACIHTLCDKCLIDRDANPTNSEMENQAKPAGDAWSYESLAKNKK